MYKRKCAHPGCSNTQSPKYRFCSLHRTSGVVIETVEETPAPLQVEEVTEEGNNRNITKSTTERVKTLADLIRVCEIDTETWEIVSWEANKWEMGWKDKADTAHALPLYQVKAKLRRKVEIIAAKNEIEELKVLAKAQILKPGIHPSTSYKVTRVYQSSDTGNLLELDIFDLHLGKLAWSKETGYENYDLKIARKLFEEAIEVLLRRTSSHVFDQILFPVGNDFFHADNLLGETTLGTKQDCEGRFHKTAHIGREMVVAAIERLRQVAPVVVKIVSGNHDQLTAWHLGESLECYFHRDIDVVIDNAPTLRKYHEFGKVMLMLTHGNKGKLPNYPLLMATEQPEMWGRTKFREAHTGHIHQKQTQEFQGVKVRTFGALCAVDAWHSEMQLVGNQRTAEAFVWNDTEGEIAHATYTAPEKQ